VRASDCKHRYQYESLFHYHLRVVHSSNIMYNGRKTQYHLFRHHGFIHTIPPIIDEQSRYGFGRQRSIDELLNQTACAGNKNLWNRKMLSILVLSLKFTQSIGTRRLVSTFSSVKHLERTSHQHATHSLRVAFVDHFLAPNALEPIIASRIPPHVNMACACGMTKIQLVL
jgi:hypothetical protein